MWLKLSNIFYAKFKEDFSRKLKSYYFIMLKKKKQKKKKSGKNIHILDADNKLKLKYKEW